MKPSDSLRGAGVEIKGTVDGFEREGRQVDRENLLG